MAKLKVYDIFPPNKAPFKKVKTGEKKTKGSSSKKALIIGLVIALILIIVWAFSSAKRVIIELWPTIFPVEFTTTVNFSTKLNGFDIANVELSDPVLPAELLEMEKSFSQEFPASSMEASEKAVGIITVYSESSRTISLVEGTRFLSSTEPSRLFRTQEKITVPAGGSVKVSVIASEPGADYNIGPCTFSVPGLRNYSPPQLYYDIYGKSAEKMTGGSTESVKKITQDDVDKASKKILEAAENQIVALFEEEVGDDYRILDKSIDIEVLEKGLVDTVLEEEKDTFVYQIKVKANTLAVKTEFLNKFIQSYLLASVPANKSIQEDTFKIEFLPTTFSSETDDEGETTISADVSVSTKIYSQVDEESIKEVAKNRNKKIIARYVMEIYPELRKRPLVRFAPFWARRACSDAERIEIKLNFN